MPDLSNSCQALMACRRVDIQSNVLYKDMSKYLGSSHASLGHLAVHPILGLAPGFPVIGFLTETSTNKLRNGSEVMRDN